jgi:hypothetical protein
MSYLGRSCGYANRAILLRVRRMSIVEKGLPQEVSRSHSTAVLVSDTAGRTEQNVVAKYNTKTGRYTARMC